MIFRFLLFFVLCCWVFVKHSLLKCFSNLVLLSVHSKCACACLVLGIAVCSFPKNRSSIQLHTALPRVLSNTLASAVPIGCQVGTGRLLPLSQEPLIQTTSYLTLNFLGSSAIYRPSVNGCQDRHTETPLFVGVEGVCGVCAVDGWFTASPGRSQTDWTLAGWGCTPVVQSNHGTQDKPAINTLSRRSHSHGSLYHQLGEYHQP